MKLVLFIIISHIIVIVSAQQRISGTVTDRKGNPVQNTNIYFEGSYDGTTSDSTGDYSFNTGLTGRQMIVASFIGFEKYSREVDLGSNDTTIDIALTEEVSELNEVVITAGVFSASDKKKSATLNSFDIATTASAMGDIYGAVCHHAGISESWGGGIIVCQGRRRI